MDNFIRNDKKFHKFLVKTIEYTPNENKYKYINIDKFIKDKKYIFYQKFMNMLPDLVYIINDSYDEEIRKSINNHKIHNQLECLFNPYGIAYTYSSTYYINMEKLAEKIINKLYEIYMLHVLQITRNYVIKDVSNIIGGYMKLPV